MIYRHAIAKCVAYRSYALATRYGPRMRLRRDTPCEPEADMSCCNLSCSAVPWLTWRVSASVSAVTTQHAPPSFLEATWSRLSIVPSESRQDSWMGAVLQCDAVPEPR
eukprot:2397313-Rhodomonas_salina.1